MNESRARLRSADGYYQLRPMPERLKIRARDIMNARVPTLPRDASISDAIHLLADEEIACAIVVDDDGRPAGIITESDVLAAAPDGGSRRLAAVLKGMLVEEHHMFDSLRELRKAAGGGVADIMNSPVTCAGPEMTVAQMAAMMEKFDVAQLPVVEDRRLVGLVRRQDVIRAIAERDGPPS